MKFSLTLLTSILYSSTLVLAGKGQLNVLSFNVAGLPEFLQNNGESLDKTTATKEIGKYFANYQKFIDIIHVQEDFHYNDILYKYDTHPYHTKSSGDVPFGSGLNTLSNYPYIHFERHKWNHCSDASSFDCWTPKGFTSMKILFDDDAIINFINLHADAGTEDGDEDARNSNLQQVSDFINSNCPDEAVIIFGDTNSRYTRSKDNIEIFHNQNGLINPWIQISRNGDVPKKGSSSIMCDLPSNVTSCETVDKLFYRGSKTIDLNATSFNYADGLFTYNGNQLSDHNPIFVNFTYITSNDFKTSKISGGYHGTTYFNDISKINTGVKPTKLSFKGHSRLDSVGLTLNDGNEFFHGGNGGQLSELKLNDDEYWTKSYLCTGKKNGHTRNFYINATTSAGNTLEAGKSTNNCELFEAPEGYQIAGFYGNNGDEVDLLGFIYIKQ